MRLSFECGHCCGRADYRSFARGGSELILRSYRCRFSFAFHAEPDRASGPATIVVRMREQSSSRANEKARIAAGFCSTA
ncbi:hypothetical protein [Burkholderia ambifaria]|uniref:hypothetical protein n=1 Tax=Burkholderia ambifaria TaxID=152480 RepID=UPI0011B25FCA|nr:hypothetical protein [Burkholderia ambifaria]